MRYFSAIECDAPLRENVDGGAWLVQHDAGSRDSADGRGSFKYGYTELASLNISTMPSQLPKPAVCLVFKIDYVGTYTAAVSSADGIKFVEPPVLVMPRVWHAMAEARRPCAAALAEGHKRFKKDELIQRLYTVRTLCHGEGGAESSVALTPNVAITRRNGTYVAMGGTYRIPSGLRTGVWMARSRSLEFAPGASVALLTDIKRRDWRVGVAAPQANWHGLRWILDGLQSECIERRSPKIMPWVWPDACEFDGRLSVVFHRSRYLIFARANVAAKGQRFVQVAHSKDADGVNWSAFQALHVRGYEPYAGNIYFWGAQTNPADSETLVAIFPIVHHLSGCIGIAASRDGVRWSSITPLIPCGTSGDRTFFQPAAPALVREPGRDDMLLLYVHEYVPGLAIDAFTPTPLYRYLDTRMPPASVARFRFPLSLIAAWSRRALSELS